MSRTAITIGFLILLSQLILLVSARTLFPANGANVELALIIYLLMEAVVLASLDARLPGLKSGIPDLAIFFISFTLTAFAVMTFIPRPIAGSVTILHIEVFTILTFIAGIIYAFNTAFIEEVIFRGEFLPQVGLKTQAVLFGLFHLAVLTLTKASFEAIIAGVLILTALGYIWGVIAQRYGVFASTGSHLAWNLHAIGILAMVIGGV